MALLPTIKNLLAISGLTLITLGMDVTCTQAAQITFNFAGTVSSINSGNFLNGSVTFNTQTTPIDIRGVGDQGERLFYRNAISDLTFSTGVVTRTFPSGDIQVWNDYQFCLARVGTQCLNSQSEPDRLFFTAGSSESFVQLIVSGNNQELLTSGALPTQLPLEQNIFRVDFFWDTFDDSDSIASNNIQLIRQPVPDPNALGGTAIAVTMSWWITRKRKTSCKSAIISNNAFGELPPYHSHPSITHSDTSS
ncbi:MAG: hypothetical protein MET45_21495 [Nostoc sp. LLA-1]|nr:hypothetical protein [Cyanocohniella sp. LLY]